MLETTLSADRIRILIFGFAHFFVALTFLVWSMGWQMWLLDSGRDSAPLAFGFYVVFSLDLLFSLPVRLPLTVAASYFGTSDSIFNNVYWFMFIAVVNSLLAAMMFGFVLRWWRNRHSTI